MSRIDNRNGPLGTVGSGNVFADLGLPNPEERLLKSKLVAKMMEVIDARNLTQSQAGEIMGLAQPKVCDLLKGRVGPYSIDRLYRYLTRLGVSVSITLENQPDWSEGNVEVFDAMERENVRAPAPSM